MEWNKRRKKMKRNEKSRDEMKKWRNEGKAGSRRGKDKLIKNRDKN